MAPCFFHHTAHSFTLWGVPLELPQQWTIKAHTFSNLQSALSSLRGKAHMCSFALVLVPIEMFNPTLLSFSHPFPSLSHIYTFHHLYLRRAAGPMFKRQWQDKNSWCSFVNHH